MKKEVYVVRVQKESEFEQAESDTLGVYMTFKEADDAAEAEYSRVLAQYAKDCGDDDDDECPIEAKHDSAQHYGVSCGDEYVDICIDYVDMEIPDTQFPADKHTLVVEFDDLRTAPLDLGCIASDLSEGSESGKNWTLHRKTV